MYEVLRVQKLSAEELGWSGRDQDNHLAKRQRVPDDEMVWSRRGFHRRLYR